jgi:hypothetical protein
MRFTSSSRRAHAYEHRFFSAAMPATLHSHVIHEASFRTDPTITIHQDPQDPCRVTSFEVRINWRHSLAKTVLRLRTAIVAWTVGVIALVLREQSRQQRTLGKQRRSSFVLISRANAYIHRSATKGVNPGLSNCMAYSVDSRVGSTRKTQRYGYRHLPLHIAARERRLDECKRNHRCVVRRYASSNCIAPNNPKTYGIGLSETASLAQWGP